MADEKSVSDEELANFGKMVFALSREDIDELFYCCGWIDAEASADGNKALPNKRIDFIKASLPNATDWVAKLLFDTPTPDAIVAMKLLLVRTLDELAKK